MTMSSFPSFETSIFIFAVKIYEFLLHVQGLSKELKNWSAQKKARKPPAFPSILKNFPNIARLSTRCLDRMLYELSPEIVFVFTYPWFQHKFLKTLSSDESFWQRKSISCCKWSPFCHVMVCEPGLHAQKTKDSITSDPTIWVPALPS